MIFKKHCDSISLKLLQKFFLKKGYVNRKRGEKDRRVVYISLSEKGRKAYSHHREFHKRMIQGLLDTLNEQEQDLLVKVMQYFHDYFREHM